jgi:hypothetical protein
LRKNYHFIDVSHWPSLVACAKKLANDNATVEQQMTTYDNKYDKFDDELKPVVSFFKAAIVFFPIKAQEVSINDCTVDEIASTFPCLNNLS